VCSGGRVEWEEGRKAMGSLMETSDWLFKFSSLKSSGLRINSLNWEEEDTKRWTYICVLT